MGQVLTISAGIYVTTAAAGGVFLVIDEAVKMFKKKPERPPPSPPENMNISQEAMIDNAVNKLGMDVRNNYNYAVCGPRGTGKSSCINCIRQLDDPNPGSSDRIHDSRSAARVGITETTDETHCYKFPLNRLEVEHLAIWDIPGSGSKSHPIESYFTDKVLYAFDCILITSGSNFGGEQIRIMTEAQKYNTPVVIIITQMDHAVDVEVRRQFKQPRHYHPTLNEYRPIVQQTIEKLKSYAESQQNIVPASRIFVVSAHKFRDYLNSTDAMKWENADEDELLSGEMGRLIQYLAHQAIARQS